MSHRAGPIPHRAGGRTCANICPPPPPPLSRADAAVSRRWHVGDTPADIRAALTSGAAALGVATGVYPRAKLEALGAEPEVVVLDSLEDTDAVMAALGLE